jgi:hypothetical protein
MSPRTEMLGDGTIGGEEPLSVARRLEPLPASLPLPCGLVRILRPIVQIAMLAMLYPWQDLALRACLQTTSDRQ